MARSLRRQRSFTVGVVFPEISEGYAALVLSGIEDHLLDEGYFYFVVSHRHRKDLLEKYPLLLQQRSVEGLIAVDTECTGAVDVPVVAGFGHPESFCVGKKVFYYKRAAEISLEQLKKNCHPPGPFFKKKEVSSRTEVRRGGVLVSPEKK